MSVELILLVDNRGAEPLCTEHGLAVLLSGQGRRVLFDTGASGETLRANAAELGVDLLDIDAAIISHGHYDHTGGLALLAGMHDALDVYAHPSAWRQRWTDKPGVPMKDLSCPHSLNGLIQHGVVFHPVEGPRKLEDWLVLSGPVGGPKHGREVFVIRREEDIVVDGFEDELFCLVRGERGWAVVTGCCHRGLPNTLRAAKFLARGEPVTAVVGGLHLRNASEEDLREAAEALRRVGSPDIYPCHCSGDEAVEYLKAAFPGKVSPIAAGKRIVL